MSFGYNAGRGLRPQAKQLIGEDELPIGPHGENEPIGGNLGVLEEVLGQGKNLCQQIQERWRG